MFETKDGKQILISIQSDREWGKLCEYFLGDVRLSHDPRFASNVNRVECRDLTDKIVAEAFLQRSSDQALADLTKADVAFALLNDMAGLSAHPELRRITVETPNGPVTYRELQIVTLRGCTKASPFVAVNGADAHRSLALPC